ncbi:MAG TPA: alpha/beta hydrolase [Chryseosolibacter sp.]
MVKKDILFLHGGGEKEDYDADAKLVASLKAELGVNYAIHYPFLSNDGTPDLGRRKQIAQEISKRNDELIIVAHSFGASMLLATFSEMEINKKVAGIFLVSTPFWTGNEDWVQPFKLKDGFEHKLDRNIPLFFYHTRDDDEVPFSQFIAYKQKLPWARFREIPTGGHQLNNDLSMVALDIKQND